MKRLSLKWRFDVNFLLLTYPKQGRYNHPIILEFAILNNIN
jgi:hypothetical protein